MRRVQGYFQKDSSTKSRIVSFRKDYSLPSGVHYLDSNYNFYNQKSKKLPVHDHDSGDFN